MKNPFEHLSAKWIRAIYTCLMLAVLSVGLVNFVDLMFVKTIGNDQCAWRPLDERGSRLLITDVVPGGVTERAGIKDGDILLEVNGATFFSSAEAQQRINAVKPGGYATYLVRRGETTFETKVEILRSVNTPFLAQFLLGLGFLLVGYVVVLSRPQGRIQRRFGGYSLIMMLFFSLSSLNLDPAVDPLWKMTLLGGGFVIARFFAPSVFLRFFFHFPVRLEHLDRKWVTACLYIIGAILGIPFLFGPLKAPQVVIRMLLGTPYIFYFFGLGLFIYSYFWKIQKDRRRELRPILIGIGIGWAAFTYSLIVSASNPFTIFLNPMMLLPGALIPVVPIFFGYAVFRYRLMDIELVVRRSLLYSIVTANIAALYILIVYGAGNFIAYAFGTEENRAVNVFALAVIAFTFEPLKQRIQEWIDRFFYRERYNYQKALLEFSQELPRQMNLDQILNSMVNRISNTMHIDKVAVILCDEHFGCVSMNIERLCCMFTEGQTGLLSLLRQTRKAQSFDFLSVEPDSVKMSQSDKEKLLQAGVVLSVPMFLKDKLIGMINVGPKKSGKVYSQEDIDLLSTVGSQAAVAIENSRLHLSEIEKQRIKEEITLARKIQEGLLPKGNPQLRGLDIAGISIPATTVGGDYFDFIQLDPNKLLVVVADVSGK
ncbi:MAG TPA: GAF domain-containing protein, partial [Bacteroidota bacterium]|nr:GAF domain-containing protein [Bacteroidota bacterium]